MSNKNYRSKNHRVYSCQYHVIICPKYRKKIFKYGIDIRLKEIILETAKMYKFEIPDIEVMPDHAHMIIECDPEKGIVDCIQKNIQYLDDGTIIINNTNYFSRIKNIT